MSIRAVVASLVLLLSPLMLLEGAAQPGKHGGGPPGKAAGQPGPVPRAAPPPQVSAPRPMAAPPPRMATPSPRVTPPPRHTAPPPRIAAPHRPAPPPRFAAPQRAPRFAEPRVSAPRAVHGQRATRPMLRGGERPLAQRPSHMPRRAQQVRQPTPQSSLQARQLDRSQLRQLRAQEERQIRDLRGKQQQARRQQGPNLSRAQLRQLRGQEQQQLRDLRAQQRQQRLGLVQPQTPEPRTQRADRVSPEAARQGRFAAPFQDRPVLARLRAERTAPRLAWRHGHPAAFVAWLGPVFWPYVHNDLFYYAFWPYAYDEGYWAYAYDDFVDTVFWDYGNPYASYAYAAPHADPTGRAARGRFGARSLPTQRAIAEVCEPAKGVTAWPFEEIERAVRPTAEQQALLVELRDAAAKAGAALKASCPSEFALTPPGRLQTMIVRLEPILQALRIVRPPLDRFYNSLSDEQKARFNAIGPTVGADRTRTARNESRDQEAKSCSEPKGGLTNLPIERIEDVVRPTERQRRAFDQLSRATVKAVTTLQDACPDVVPQTPVGRLEAMEKRIEAMLQAARTVQPALQDFYASLSNEQKASFNTLGREAARRR
jgi:hypothetical protein